MLGKLEEDPGRNLQTMSEECQRLINLKRVMCQTEEPEEIKIEVEAIKNTTKKKSNTTPYYGNGGTNFRKKKIPFKTNECFCCHKLGQKNDFCRLKNKE